jgi:hypothetical protein
MGSFAQDIIDKSRGKTKGAQKRAIAQAELDKRTIPDEDALLREAQRQQARRVGSRTSTILSQRTGGGSTAVAPKSSSRVGSGSYRDVGGKK